MPNSVDLSFHEPAHPAIVLVAKKRMEIRSNRALLLRQLRAASPVLARFVAAQLRRNDLTSPPRIGEAWPWFLADLAGLHPSLVRDVGQAWLAVYLYTALLDASCDEPTAQSPSASLAAALLFEIGFGDLLVLTARTSSQNDLRVCVHDALVNQIKDVQFKRDSTDLVSKRSVAAGKNSGFLVCTAAFAALGVCDAKPLDAFTRSMLLTLQHLDDIADFESDWAASNFTPLLIEAGESLATIQPGAGRFEILEQLIRSSALTNVLQDAHAALSQALPALEEAYGSRAGTPAWEFLVSLKDSIERALRSTAHAEKVLASADSHRATRLGVISEVEDVIRIVAQQS